MKVLSIDFDIIMKPSIELYNNIVPYVSWENLQKEYPWLYSIPADFQCYENLILILMSVINDKTKVAVSPSHASLYDFLDGDTNLEVYNIDHHHDLGYGEDLEEVQNQGISCANWAYQLFKEKRMKKYVWLNNSNSQKRVCSITEQDRYEEYLFQGWADNLRCMEFDKIFLCLSPEWVPPYYSPLFSTLINIIKLRTENPIAYL